MRVRVNMCDLCAIDGEVRLAKTRYRSHETGLWYDICSTHKKEIEPMIKNNPNDLTLGLDYEELGNVDSDLFSA